MNPWIIAGPVLGGYLAMWLIAARVAFDTMRVKDHLYDDDEAAMYGAFSMFLALFWPVIIVGLGPWMFVTTSARRARHKRAMEAKTARLEHELYGRTLGR